VHAARTTWFTVVPKTELMSFTSARDALPYATVRWGDVAPFQGVRGPLKGIGIRARSAAPSTIERVAPAADFVDSSRSRAKRADRWGSRESAWASSARLVGAGSLRTRSWDPHTSAPCGEGSSSCSRSWIAETPSATAWWILNTRATRPSARPSITQSSHSGRLRSSGCAASWATRSASTCSDPGAGAPNRWTWLRMRRSGSSIQTGKSKPNGIAISLRRNGARSGIRSSTRRRIRSKE
jgi:hypothetical protein